MTAYPRLPLLSHGPGDRLAWWRDRTVSREGFLTRVHQLAADLPARRFAANLCEDRYLFCVAFAAVIVRGQTNLLPSSRLEQIVQDTLQEYPDSYVLTDGDIRALLKDAVDAAPVYSVPVIAADQVAAITFTSGSTGRPQPNPKTWGSLVAGARLAQRRFVIAPDSVIVATVPPQHMYGLETSVLLALITGASIHSGRPFYPEDLRAALAAVSSPRILVTTPAHLRACTRTVLQWPALERIISATAPLSAALARATEQLFAAPVMEIYGCTESGSLASRRTLEGDLWRTYDGVTVHEDGGRCYARGGHLPAEVALGDVLALQSDRVFRLLGRDADMVNVAGKRASLANLNYHLNVIEGVVDGVFVVPEDPAVHRLTALVVAPYKDKRAILAALAKRIDPAFLPRPLYRVERLPRNEASKLPRSELLALLADLKKTS